MVDIASEVQTFFFHLVDGLGAFDFGIKETTDFGFGARGFLFQLREFKGQLLHIPILVGAFLAVFEPFQFFLFGGDVGC